MMRDSDSWVEDIMSEVESREAAMAEERMFDEDYAYGGGSYYSGRYGEDEENGSYYYD